MCVVCRIAACLLVCSGVAQAARAQARAVRVGLEVAENTGGELEAAFRVALRGLPEVEVVAPEDGAELTLTVVIVCLPRDTRCATASAYSAAVLLTEPLAAGTPARTTSRGGSLDLYERRLGLWAASWSRDLTPEAIRAVVVQLDTLWFARRRGARDGR